MTEVQQKILEIVERDPGSEDAISKARILNNEMVELQRLTLDEAALILIVRKDVTDDEFKKDREVRKERQDRVNLILSKAIRTVEQIPTLEEGTVLELSLLTSENVPEVDEEYDHAITKATIDQEEVEVIQWIHDEKDRIQTRERDVSP